VNQPTPSSSHRRRQPSAGTDSEIVILAGRGLSNAEIADRLFLSPRTVASHLYRSYPKLGIAGRHQLRDLIDQAGTARVNS
jgi:DNA-binding CsgD family transcriptional regulator